MATRAIRPIVIDGNTACIPLTQGYVAIIDASDVPMVEDYNWHATRCRGIIYAGRNRPTRRGGVELLHRAIMSANPGTMIDHIDGNALDNRRSNLRIASHAENMRNARRSARNTSGIKGVSFNRTAGKWVAYICIDRKQVHLGTFATAESAQSARADAATRLHGDFARHR